MSPDDYGQWSDRARGLAEALILKDATTNKYGIPHEIAFDKAMGFDVSFDQDMTEQAVADERKRKYGDKDVPVGLVPRVGVNPHALERVRRERDSAATNLANHEAGDPKGKAERQ